MYNRLDISGVAVRRLAGIDRSRPELTMSSAMAVAAASHAAFSPSGPAAKATKQMVRTRQ